jgi:hypothetical protein
MYEHKQGDFHGMLQALQAKTVVEVESDASSTSTSTSAGISVLGKELGGSSGNSQSTASTRSLKIDFGPPGAKQPTYDELFERHYYLRHEHQWQMIAKNRCTRKGKLAAHDCNFTFTGASQADSKIEAGALEVLGIGVKGSRQKTEQIIVEKALKITFWTKDISGKWV